MNFKAILGAAASVSVLAAMPAAAALHQVDFTVNPGSWVQNFGSGFPFGLSGDPTLSGSFVVDTNKSGAAAFVSLSYMTGSKAWALTDLEPISNVQYTGPNLTQAFLIFDQFNYVVLSDTAQVSDGTNAEFCNGCVSFTIDGGAGGGGGAVPEPATWALMLAGFGLIGATLRRRPALA